MNFYCTCISPTMEYASEPFHHSLLTYLSNELERVQKRALAIIYRGNDYPTNLKNSGLITLSESRQSQREKLFKKITTTDNHKLYPLLPPKHQSKYNVSHKRSYELPITYTNRFRNTFIPSICYIVLTNSSDIYIACL